MKSSPRRTSAGAAPPKVARRRNSSDAVRGKVKPHDPFELIRWLAFSQPDPRKALAELVQNSLDADARRVRVIRVRERGVPCLKIVDDGVGVIPEMDRPKALEYIATHIGHSRKRALSPQERLQLMTQGQYGIGLLGFWSLGQRLEIRSSVPGQTPRRLVLHRDDPNFEIEPLRGRLALDERWTEVVVVGVHKEALNVLSGRRAADYLSSELRGQLLRRDVDLVVEDRMARGTAPKQVPVRPPRFLGERIPELDHLDVPGHPPIRLEVYFTGESDGAHAGGLSVYSAGTLVADSFQQMGAFGLDRAPWTDARLTGLVDWPGFHVAPGSRRGVIADESADAFTRVLLTAEPVLVALLERVEKQRADQMDRTVVRDLQRAFREFYRRRPRYSMLPIHEANDRAEAPSEATIDATSRGDSSPGASNGDLVPRPGSPPGSDHDVDPDVPMSLLPAGPIASLVVRPASLLLECGAAKSVRATALDAAGQPVLEAVHFEWFLESNLGRVEDTGVHNGRGTAMVTAATVPGSGTLNVTAYDATGCCAADVPVEVREDIAKPGASEGIPEPEFVNHPGAPWRSRMVDDRWQVNSGHADYQSAADKPPLKLRYLALLFAKEIVLRSSQDPRLEIPLEQIVEVATFADLNLATRGGRGRVARS